MSPFRQTHAGLLLHRTERASVRVEGVYRCWYLYSCNEYSTVSLGRQPAYERVAYKTYPAVS
jgi:hypothetical protein